MGKHIPIRECISCHKKGEKESFIRIVRQENVFLVDATKNMQGRGAYICPMCLKNPQTMKRRPLDRAFRQKVPQMVYDSLIKQGEEQDFFE